MFAWCLLLSLFLITRSDRLCIKESGRERTCCNGFRWNFKEQKCIRCSVGFYGHNCARKCRYPNYGEKCQLKCSCNRTFCDASHGCKNQGLSDENKTDSIKPVLYVIIPVVCLSSSAIICSVIFLIHKKKKLSLDIIKTENNPDSNLDSAMPTIPEGGNGGNFLSHDPNRQCVSHTNTYEAVSSSQSKNHRYDFLMPGHCLKTGEEATTTD